jgi:hypothetical protein
MTDSSTRELSIRDAVVCNRDLGYILACDPETEADTPYAWIRAWNHGQISESWVAFNAHSVCRTVLPEPGVVLISSEGFYCVFSGQLHAGNIYDESQPQPAEPRYGSFSSVAQIGGRAYAVGLRGMVYRLDAPASWTRIDEELSREFDVHAIHGFSESDIYAVGNKGELWQFNGQSWLKRELPTKVNLSCVKCTEDGIVYIGGDGGLLIRGRSEAWEILDESPMRSDIWGIDWFAGELYVSTFSGLYRLKGADLEPVLFGEDKPKTFYHLSVGERVLWSVGEADVMSFDGANWTRVSWQPP